MVARRARAAPAPPTHDTTQPQWSPRAQHGSFVERLHVCCALGCWQSRCEQLCQTLALCWSPASVDAGQGAEVYSVCMCERIHTCRNKHAVRLGWWHEALSPATCLYQTAAGHTAAAGNKQHKRQQGKQAAGTCSTNEAATNSSSSKIQRQPPDTCGTTQEMHNRVSCGFRDSFANTTAQQMLCCNTEHLLPPTGKGQHSQ